jgi:hypothetical protein
MRLHGPVAVPAVGEQSVWFRTAACALREFVERVFLFIAVAIAFTRMRATSVKPSLAAQRIITADSWRMIVSNGFALVFQFAVMTTI